MTSATSNSGEQEPVSVLDPRVNGGDLSHVLAVHSLSKRSSMAGYRFGFVAGDHPIIDDLLSVRKHLGMISGADSANCYCRVQR